MQNHDGNNAKFDEQNDKINTINPTDIRKMIESNVQTEELDENISLKQIKIKKQEEVPDKANNTPIYIVAILVLSMLCGVLVGMYFHQKEENKELNSKINEQSQIIYDYKFGTLP